MAVHSTTIQFLQNTGITDEHKPYFASAAARDSWFASRAVNAQSSQSYQRENLYFASAASYDTIYNADYIRYQNSPFSNKWYYGKIVRKDWDNEGLTLVYFEIDNFITYMFDFSLNACFVEREHVNGDWDGGMPSYNNTFDEGLETGDYYVHSEIEDELGNNVYVVAYNQDPNGNLVNGSIETGVYSACSYFYTESFQDVNNFLRAYDGAGVGDAILAVMIIPEQVFTGESNITPVPLPQSWYGGYTPKNAKCFTSPYNLIMVESPSGDNNTYSFENFVQPNNASFYRDSSFSLQAASRIIPQQYKNTYRWHEEAVIFNNFPQAAWTSDAYANWLAQNSNTVSATLGASAIASIVGFASGNVPVAIGGLIGAGTSLAKINDRRVNKSQARGEVTTSTANITWNRNHFTIKICQIRQESIIRIDDYFSAFGYKVNQLKVPNIRTRPYWNYVKTSNCVINARCPQVAAIDIKNMFNSGVTLWHVDQGATIGNYTLDNRG